MKIDNTNIGSFDLTEVKKAIESKEPIEISTFSMTREVEDAVNNVLLTFVETINQLHLLSYMSYSTLELLANANKANTKRVFFQEKHLDIFDEKDYKNGMLTFSTELTINKKHFQDLVEANGYFIKLILQLEDIIRVKVINKAELTPAELERINEKFERAKRYKTMDEALSDIDRTEGSGLGIIIIVLMLKQLGLDRENLKFECKDGFTTFEILIPLDTVEVI